MLRRARDVIEHHQGAERARRLVGLEKRIDHGQAVAEHVGQRDGEEIAALVGSRRLERRRYSMMRVSMWLSSTIMA